VSSSVIEAAIVSGAATVADVTGRCRAGGRCGSCRTTIEALLGSSSGGLAHSAQPAGV
jgi:bacterioferritin-associated ferredoxin